MCTWVVLFGKAIPGYGLYIVLGIVISNAIAFLKLHKEYWLNLLILESYALLGGILGAKCLYLIVSIDEINWKQLRDFDYAISIIRGGFVFYGGLLGGFLGFYIANRIHKLNGRYILERVIFAVPLAHGFGRVGCFMAGCCYGVEYKGIFAVTYPQESFGPSGISCFPVQILEAVLLWILALGVYCMYGRKKRNESVELYLIGYSAIRFGLEFLRGDLARGRVGVLSTSQWISILIIALVLGNRVREKMNGYNMSSPNS